MLHVFYNYSTWMCIQCTSTCKSTWWINKILYHNLEHKQLSGFFWRFLWLGFYWNWNTWNKTNQDILQDISIFKSSVTAKEILSKVLSQSEIVGQGKVSMQNEVANHGDQSESADFLAWDLAWNLIVHPIWQSIKIY